MGDLNRLFDNPHALAKNWWTTIATDEQRAWVDELAGMIRDRGREPTTWKLVHEAFVEEFESAPSESTLRKYVRQRVDG